MKYWLKENWFKLGILIILVIGLASYLKLNKNLEPAVLPLSAEKTKFAQFKPNIVTIPLELKEKCSKLLPKFEEEVTALDEFGVGFTVHTSDISVVYSPVLDSCIGEYRRIERMKDEGSWHAVEVGKISDLFTRQTLYAYREESPQKDTSLFLDGIKQREAYLTFLNYISNGQLGRDASLGLDGSAYGTSTNEFLLEPFNAHLGKVAG